MFIKPSKKWRNPEGDLTIMVPYTYYRLCESVRDASGRSRLHTVLGLGDLADFPGEEQRRELAELLTSLIQTGECRMSNTPGLYDAAIGFYDKWMEERRDEEQRRVRLAEEARRKAEEVKEDEVWLKPKTLRPIFARSVGAEYVCSQILKKLEVEDFLMRRGWAEEEARMALLQIASRAIYICSEHKTVRYLRENSALCEIYDIDAWGVTKDVLDNGELSLYGVRRELEDHLHRRVCDIFNIEDKIWLIDLTNTCFGSVMKGAEPCASGRSKGKRYDCKVMGFGAVVNSDGLICRTQIFEGGRHDVATIKEVVCSLDDKSDGRQRLVVLDAGFASESDLEWLCENGYDYIIVMRSTDIAYESVGEARSVTDNDGGKVRLRRVSVGGMRDKVLLVDSDFKRLKKTSVGRNLSHCYEDGGAEDTLSEAEEDLSPTVVKEVVLSDGLENEAPEVTDIVPIGARGTYLLRTSLNDTSEEEIWQNYKAVESAKETFESLRDDLEIRPVRSNSGRKAKAQLHLALLAYWVVSVIMYMLRKKGITVRWAELVRIMSTQQNVTIVAEQADGSCLDVRRSTVPEDSLATVLEALDLAP